ncbi:MAG: ATP-dependent DNA ligase [Acidimicrobiales bacterium]
MQLPLEPPVKPMLSKPIASLDKLPDVPLLYEPKWDGFRCIVFRDGDEVVLGSRNEKPLTRYFPDVVEAVLRELPPRVVVDGEIVVAGSSGLDFDALQQRIHPADSRVKRLAAETPAAFVAFDLLAIDDEALLDQPFAARRARLEVALGDVQPPIYLTPVSSDRQQGTDWFHRFEGAGLDGVIAKDPGLPYLPDKRVMLKVKHHRDADCVVAGFRTHKDGEGVGSLLLGLFDDDFTLHHVGVAASFTAAFRRELAAELEPLRAGALEGHPWQGWAEAQAGGGRMPGAQSRWNAKKDLSWEPVRCERVCEVEYDQLQSGRFRRVAHFIRWRPDREPSSCRYDQLEPVVPAELATLFATSTLPTS